MNKYCINNLVFDDLLIGHSHFSVNNTRTGTEYSYEIMSCTTPNPGHSAVNFVYTTIEGQDGYHFIGTIFDKTKFVWGNKKAKLPSNHNSVYVINLILQNKNQLPDFLKFSHMGICLICCDKLPATSLPIGYCLQCKSILMESRKASVKWIENKLINFLSDLQVVAQSQVINGGIVAYKETTYFSEHLPKYVITDRQLIEAFIRRIQTHPSNINGSMKEFNKLTKTIFSECNYIYKKVIVPYKIAV